MPGHWEGDQLCGSKNGNIVTLVKRHSRYVMLAKVPNRETKTVVNALNKQAGKNSLYSLDPIFSASYAQYSKLNAGDRLMVN